MLPLLAACGGDDERPPRTDDRGETAATADTGGSTETADTGTPPGAADDCRLDPGNALRAWCTSPAPATGDLRVDVVDGDGAAVGTFRPDPALGDGILVWGVEPDRPYEWRLRDEAAGVDLAGSFRAGPLPEDLRVVSLDVIVPAGDTRLDAFLFSPTCPSGFAIMMDADGDVIWYQDLHLGGEGGSVTALAWTEDRTVLAHTSRSQVRELDLAGNVRLDLERGTDFDDYVHHDLFRKDGLTYDLRAREGVAGAEAIIADGVYVFDADGAVVDEIDLEGAWPFAYDPQVMIAGYWDGLFGDAIDFSHANSVFVDGNGDVWLSLKHLSAIAKLQGGPGTPGFGTLLWTAVGHAGSVVAAENDFALSGPGDATFQSQHDVHVASDGAVLMLDNGLVGEPTRALRWSIDEPGRALDLLEAWETGQNCPVLGSTRELDDGHVLVTCHTTGTIFEFAPGDPAPIFQARVRCDTFLAPQVPRAIPVRR